MKRMFGKLENLVAFDMPAVSRMKFLCELDVYRHFGRDDGVIDSVRTGIEWVGQAESWRVKGLIGAATREGMNRAKLGEEIP
ncbi:MAG: hypothetical protein LBT97_03110 [Planctomycetota bacterium]|jgi:hypothetical protein|nr:hypothetical protein [Planctomycetota bacterium]